MILSVVCGVLAVGAAAVLLTLGAIRVDAKWETLDEPEDLTLDNYTCRVLYKAITGRLDQLEDGSPFSAGLTEALDIIYEAMDE